MERNERSASNVAKTDKNRDAKKMDKKAVKSASRIVKTDINRDEEINKSAKQNGR